MSKIQNPFASVKWARKPATWSEAYAGKLRYSKGTIAALSKLQVIAAPPSPSDTVTVYTPYGRTSNSPEQYYIAMVGTRAFLVNNEGYDYARYAAWIPPRLLKAFMP